MVAEVVQMTAEQIAQALTDMQIQSAAHGQRYAGLMNLFNACCTVGDTAGMDNMREQLHGIIDNILDTNAQIYMLTRQLLALQGRT